MKFPHKQLLTAILIGSIVIIILQRPIRLLLDDGGWIGDFGHGFTESFWLVFWLCYNEHLIDTTVRHSVPEACGELIGLITQVFIVPISTGVLIDRIMFLWKRRHTGETSDLST